VISRMSKSIFRF